MAKSSREVLRLVEMALEEFDTVPLAASVRRTIRIATLLGDSQTAVRLSFEVKVTGGDRKANAADTRRLLADEATWGEPDGPAERALESWMKDRALPDDPEGRLAAHSVSELEFWQIERIPPGEMTPSQYGEDLKMKLQMLKYLEICRQRTFVALIGYERDLTFAATNEAALALHQRRVDELLANLAPDVLTQFNAVFRRLSEASDAGLIGGVDEELAQAVTSCRRILKSVVDRVQPPDPAKRASDTGNPLTDPAYKNRLFEYLKASTGSETMGDALTTASQALWERFEATDTLASKGVHASVARDEAELCALNTYLVAGEVLRIYERNAREAHAP